MMDGCCSVSNMQTTPVNQAGIERLPIIWNQTEGDDYLGEGLGSFAAAMEVAYWLAIRELITQGYLHVAWDSLPT